MPSGPEAVRLALRLGHEVGVLATPRKIDYGRAHLDEACRRLDYQSHGRGLEGREPAGGDGGLRGPRRGGPVGCPHFDRRHGPVLPAKGGDTPILGAGTYCTPRAAVSLTGVGERILVLLSAKRLVDLLSDGRPQRQAAEAVIGEIESVGSGRLIALDASGEMVAPRNARFMALARRR